MDVKFLDGSVINIININIFVKRHRQSYRGAGATEALDLQRRWSYRGAESYRGAGSTEALELQRRWIYRGAGATEALDLQRR